MLYGSRDSLIMRRDYCDLATTRTCYSTSYPMLSHHMGPQQNTMLTTFNKQTRASQFTNIVIYILHEI